MNSKLIGKIALAFFTLTLFASQPSKADITYQPQGPTFQLAAQISVYPNFVQIPGYPVYYDPDGVNNYFFMTGIIGFLLMIFGT